MAYAICIQCGTGVRWYAGKGRKLKHISCPKCGGRLKMASWSEYQGCKNRVDLVEEEKIWREAWLDI